MPRPGNNASCTVLFLFNIKKKFLFTTFRNFVIAKHDGQHPYLVEVYV